MATNPVGLDPFQRITEVGWSSLTVIIEVYANSGNMLAGQIQAGSGVSPGEFPAGPHMVCPTPGTPFPWEIKTDPMRGNVPPVEFPPTKAMLQAYRAWAERFAIGDPVEHNQSVHPFMLHLQATKFPEPVILTVVGVSLNEAGAPVYGGIPISYVDRVTVRFFNHTKWKDNILFVDNGFPIVRRDGPVFEHAAGEPSPLAAIEERRGSGPGETKTVRIELSRKDKTAAVRFDA